MKQLKPTQLTLLTFLQSLKSFEPAYSESSNTKKHGRVYRIKCWQPLSPADWKKLQAKIATVPQKEIDEFIVEIKNDHMWRDGSAHSVWMRPVFVIRTKISAKLITF